MIERYDVDDYDDIYQESEGSFVLFADYLSEVNQLKADAERLAEALSLFLEDAPSGVNEHIMETLLARAALAAHEEVKNG